MPWTFRILKPDGTVGVDLGSRVMRGLQSFPTNGVNGSATVQGVETGTPIIVPFNGGPNAFPPEVSLSGSTLTWTYPFSRQFSMAGTIYVMVY